MLKTLLGSEPVLNKWMIVVRIISGVMIARYGLEVFNKQKMDGNIAWLTDIHFPLPLFMAFLGKSAELIGGVFLILGLLTRFATIVLLIDMVVVIFVMGGHNLFGDEQLPFLLMTLFICFLIQGGGELSLDHLLFTKKK